jgi:hypothetical protein
VLLAGVTGGFGDEFRQEVLIVESYTMTRPSTLTAVCAPVPAGYVLAATDVPQLPQTHEVRVQAELVRVLPRVEQRHEINGSNGTTGLTGVSAFLGSEFIPTTATKRLMDGARGVPPRGRPV